MAQAQAAILIQARDQATQNINQIFVNINQQLGKTAQAHTTAAKAADAHKFSIVDLAAKLYLLQVGFRNILQTLENVKALAEFGAELEQQDVAFRKIVEGAGKDYDSFLKQLSDSTNGTIANFQLQQITADALIGTQGQLREEIANSLPNLLAIAKAYSDLHPEVGSTEKVFEALTNGIRRGSPRLIDNAKIILGLTESYEAYATKIGKSVDQLTEEERQLAVLSMVQEKGRIIQDQAGESLSALTDRYEKFDVHVQNSKAALGEFLNYAISPSIDAFNESAEAIENLGNRFDEAGGFIKGFGMTWGLMFMAIQKTLNPLVMISDALVNLDRATADWEDSLGRTAGALKDVVNAVSPLADELNNATYAVEDFSSAWDNAMKDYGEVYLRGQQKIEEESKKAAESIFEVSQKLQDRLTEIHADAAEKRFDIDKDFNERGLAIQEKYLEDRAELENRLSAIRGGESPLTKAAAELKRLQDEATKAAAQGIDPTKLFPWLDPEFRVRGERFNLPEAIAELEKRVREERIQSEIATLDKKFEIEMSKLREQAAERLNVVSANEESATRKVEEESEKRTKKLISDLNDVKKSVKEDFEMAWIEALQSVTTKGSLLFGVLEDVRLKALGASEAQIAYLDALNKQFNTPASLLMLIQGLSGLNLQQQANEEILQSYLTSIGRENGGSTTPGTAYRVGESGPEWLVSPGGNIVPERSGSNANINITVSTVLGGEAEATQFGNLLIPIIVRGLKATNSNIFSTGPRRTSTLSI